MEHWKSIAVSGFEHYVVSSEGNIVNTRTLKRVSGWLNEQGYQRVKLSSGSVEKRMYVHRIVALTFLECPGDAYEVHHKDNSRTNNRLDNLEWLTHAENMAHVHSKEDLGEFAEPVECDDDLPF